MTAKPTITEDHYPETFHYDCGSVTLVEQGTSDVRTTVFHDHDGTPVRKEIHVKFVGVITNPNTGQIVDDKAHFTISIDSVTGETSYLGNLANLTEPGKGTVLQNVGRFTFNSGGDVVFEAGKHIGIAVGNALGPAICKALVGSPPSS